MEKSELRLYPMVAPILQPLSNSSVMSSLSQSSSQSSPNLMPPCREAYQWLSSADSYSAGRSAELAGVEAANRAAAAATRAHQYKLTVMIYPHLERQKTN